MSDLPPARPRRRPLLEVSGFEQDLTNRDRSQRFAVRVQTFVLREGEWIAVVGPTGCGKSTLLHALGLLRRSTRVEQFLFHEPREGGPPLRHDVRQLWQRGRQTQIESLRRRQFGYAFQRPELISSFKVGENVEIPLRLNQSPGIPERVRELLGALSRPDSAGTPDLLRVARSPTYHISGGQAQRVGLARALAHRPSALFLDEPTSNLDEGTARHVLCFLDKVRRDEGTAIVMVTHDETLVGQFADRVIRMGMLGEGVGGLVEERPVAPQLDPQPADAATGAAG